MISTHVLDTSRGQPASGVRVVLEQLDRDGASMLGREISRGETDADGRIRELSPAGMLEAGRYRLIFDTGSYFAALRVEAFYPQVVVVFVVRDATQHYHVPVLLSPYGYSTYRGT
jgi:5-hydroxyisourate hydrolase